MYKYEMDKRFIQYFDGRMHQVFFYLTDQCQIRCKQCLYKPNLTFHMGNDMISPQTVKELGADFHQMGASKVTLMGGEPALYGDLEHNNLQEIIKCLRGIGYEYIRMDTNDLYEDDMLALEGIKELDEISFSLDGYDEETNGFVRGSNCFEKTVNNIKRAIELNYNVYITTCVHKKLAEKNVDGFPKLKSMIEFADSIGVREINFHVLLKHGFPMDTWTEDTAITVAEWMEIREVLEAWLDNFAETHNIRVRIPQHFVSKERFEKNKEFYGYCPVKLGERILVHPDGQLRICSGLISSKYCIAKYIEKDKKIIWEEGNTNEITDHTRICDTPCTNQSKGMDCGEDIVPLCFSFKPMQKEYVWKNKLRWDDNENNELEY